MSIDTTSIGREFDSYSGRISWNPTQNLALQVSHGYLQSPEALEPNVNQHRTTASAIYNMPLGPDRNWSSSFVWGQNNDTGEGKTQSFLVESNYQRGRDTVYGRWELVEKSGHELALNPSDQEKIFTVNALTAGYVHDFSHGNKIDIGLGGQFTLNVWPSGLDRYYGDGVGYGFQFFSASVLHCMVTAGTNTLSMPPEWRSNRRNPKLEIRNKVRIENDQDGPFTRSFAQSPQKCSSIPALLE